MQGICRDFAREFETTMRDQLHDGIKYCAIGYGSEGFEEFKKGDTTGGVPYWAGENLYADHTKEVWLTSRLTRHVLD